MKNKVLLGFAESVLSFDEERDIFASRIGGKPIWLFKGKKPEIKCKNCRGNMFLLLECYAPVNSDRFLYIFGCNQKRCSALGGFRVFRVSVEKAQVAELEKKIEKIDWFQEFETPQEIDVDALLSETKDVRGKLKDEEKDSNNDELKDKLCDELNDTFYDELYPLHFPGYFMEVDEEQIPSSDSIEQHIDSLKKSYDKAPLPSNDGIDWSKEGYERSKLDKLFIMFQAKVSFNPTQCLRYKFNNPEPLLYSSKNKAKINKARKCPICNCPRVHEMQLMPSLLSILPVEEYAENESKEKKKSVLETFGMEFGTIHIFTCINDCSPGAYHEEEILVETESDI